VYLISVLFYFVWLRLTLNLVDKKELKPFFSKFIPSLTQFGNLILTFILIMFIISIGFVLLIVPGFYFSGRLFPAIYICIDENKNAFDSISKSWEITKDYGWIIFWKSLLIGLCMMIVMLIVFILTKGLIGINHGFILFTVTNSIIQTLIVSPILFVVLAMLYREFTKFKSQMPAIIEEGVKQENITQ
jgi:hypothetical protein